LNITDSNKKTILKNYDSQATNLQTLINRATQLNAKAKNRAAQRQELSNYINNLGINGTSLLQKFNSGRSTLDRLKAEANKMKSLANAREVNSKKDDIRTFMKNTLLKNSNKKSFLNRVQLNTNVDTLKGEIRDLNTILKGRSDALVSKRSELSVFLNTLNDLTPKQRKGLINKVTNANTNINSIKLEGQLINKAVKNKRNANKKAEEEKKIEEAEKQRAKDEKRLEKHLLSLKHLTSKEMESYLQDFRDEKAGLQDLITFSKAKDADNEKDKDAVRNYVRKAVIPQAKKTSYLTQLNKPHVNITPIKALVNSNVEAEKVVVQKAIAATAAEIKRLTSITKNEKIQFEARLKTEPRHIVLNQAKKLDANRKEAKKAKDKQTKNLAESLQTLTTLTRNNRKIFMSRLNKNGAQKVLTNAVALNDQRKAKAKAEENARLAEERKRKAVEEAKKKKEQNMKNVSMELQKLTNLTKSNRGAYIKRLNTMSKNTIITEAKSEDARRKREKEKRRQAEEERKARNAQTKQTATKLQSLDKLGRDNRKRFMDRVSRGENSKMVLKNAEKLQRDRLAKQKLETERKAREQERKEREQKVRNYERQKQAKLRSNTAKMLQGMSGLERSNRKEFMTRLNRGNDPTKVIANARKRDAATKSKKVTTPSYTASTKSSAIRQIRSMRGMGAKNQDRFVRRINAGENPNSVLRDARARNKKAKGMTSKTKKSLKELEFERKKKNVLRRL